MNTPIAATILIDDALAEYMQTAEDIGSFGYKGLTITLFQNENIPWTRLARIEGLGHILHMCYVFVPGDPEVTGIPVTDIAMFFRDFQNFVMMERMQDAANLQ